MNILRYFLLSFMLPFKKDLAHNRCSTEMIQRAILEGICILVRKLKYVSKFSSNSVPMVLDGSVLKWLEKNI